MASRSANHQEGLKIARILMVLSSLSPLFILLAIRGNSVIPDFYFVGVCILLVIVPTFFLWCRIREARKDKDQRELRCLRC